jgi:cobalt/nickel transport system permease protein/cobalt/nickel transport protein
MSKVSTRALVGAGLLVALLLAGVVSYYASTSPDGLNRVAEDKGFSDTQTKHVSDGSPLAGYGTKGVDDPRLSGGLAGVLGCVVVLALAGGLTYVVRRRGAGDARPDEHTAPAGNGGP